MSSDLGEWGPIFRLAARREPDLLKALEVQFPEFKNSIRGVRVYGSENANADRKSQDTDRKSQLADSVVDTALEAALSETRNVFDLVERRSTLLRRLKFVGGVLAALAGGGTVGALVQGAPNISSMTAAIVALGGTIVSLYAIYVDEGAGGEGAIFRIRENLATHRRTVILLRGELQLARLTGDGPKLLDVVNQLNMVAADAEFARARLGA
ncbi:hypothetical protein ML401_20290 [Bradyrhizobium sp. 62B]|uniref:hypothetical protein n=1 Tax=Bradyrhizobium sp. 62B TaxID=2898442 RepID=UPI002557FD5F|nr:hypothetical protein ML401_20290 [Bradyrhizobium sp. 62B]